MSRDPHPSPTPPPTSPRALSSYERTSTQAQPQGQQQQPQAWGLLTAAPPSMREAAARMNATAVGLVESSTVVVFWFGTIFGAIGVLFTLSVFVDFGYHHVLGYWPAAPEARELMRLRIEHTELQQQAEQFRLGMIECIDLQEKRADASGEP